MMVVSELGKAVQVNQKYTFYYHNFFGLLINERRIGNRTEVTGDMTNNPETDQSRTFLQQEHNFLQLCLLESVLEPSVDCLTVLCESCAIYSDICFTSVGC